MSAIFLDLRKAFDCVDFGILLFKLNLLGLPDHMLKLFREYLINRTQYVQMDDFSSSSEVVVKGVPQGSILGPLFFIYYINDIFNLKLKGQLQLYADDACLLYKSAEISDLQASMISDVKIVSDWLKLNLLSINAEKSNYIIFEKRSIVDVDDDFQLTIDNQNICRTYVVKYLGLVIDSKLTWENHIQKVRAKLSSASFLIRRIKSFIKINVLWKIYYAYFHSQLMYLSAIWSSASQQRLQCIKVLQNRTLKNIKSLHYLTPTRSLYSDGVLPFQSISDLNIILFIFKIKHNLIRNNFCLSSNSDFHSYSTRNQNDYYISKVNSTKAKSDIIYRGIVLYNNLTENMKNESNLIKFTKLCKDYLRDIYLAS